jgi:diguanylate cyclase (GGDEF)-like protein/PAS domain S-box-containing protein
VKSFEKFLDLSDVIFLVIGKDGKIIFSNETTSRILGYSKEFLHRKNWVKTALNYEELKRVRKVFSMIMRGKINEVKNFENYVMTKDKKKRLISWKNSYIKDKNDEIVAIVSAGEDITEKRKMEENLIRLNRLIKAITNINKLITKESSEKEFIKKACEEFVKTRGYLSSLIITFDKNGKYKEFAFAGEISDNPIFIKKIKSLDIPCIKNILNKNEMFFVKDSDGCKECPDFNACKKGGIISLKLAYSGKIWGILSATVPQDYLDNEEEIVLFREVSEDIAFALYKIEMEKSQKNLQEEIEKNEKRLRNLFEHTSIGIYRTTPDGKILFANPAFLNMVGYDSLEELEKGKNEIIDVIGYPRENFKSLIEKKGYVKGFIAKLRKKDGSPITVIENARALNDESGQRIYEGTIEDISDWVRAQKALEESELKFRTFTESIPIGIFIIQNDEFIYVNPTAIRILDINKKDLEYKNFWNFIHPEFVDMVKEKKRNFENNPEAENDYECKIVDTNGVEKWVRIIGRNIKYGGKRVRLVSFHDISEEVKRRMDILRETNFKQNLVQTVSRILSGKLDESIYNTILEGLKNSIDEVDESSILIEENGVYKFKEATFLNKEQIKKIYLTKKDIEILLKKNGTVELWNLADRFKNGSDHSSVVNRELLKNEINYSISFPIVVEKRTAGFLNIGFKKNHGQLDKSTKDMLEIFAQQIGNIIKRKKLEEELKSEKNNLQYIALHDSITGLPNRRYFIERLSKFINYHEYKGISFALIQINIERYKNVKDVFGHEIGDLLLKKIGEKISNTIHRRDELFKLEGEEFAIVLQNCDKNNVSEKLKKILSVFEEPFKIFDQYVNVSAKIGIAIYPDDGTDYHLLSRNASIALTNAFLREKGVCIFNEKQSVDLNKRTLLEQELRNTIMTGKGLSLYYQPILNLNTNKIEKLESLARWKSEKYGFISPDIFINIAEETGLIHKLDMLVMKKVKSDLKLLNDNEIDVSISFNLSVKEILRDDIVSDILNSFEGVDKRKLNIEITESTFMKDMESTLNKLNILKKEGFYLSIDDFGTGYSSLSYLQKLPVNFLKIDKSFIIDIDNDDKSNENIVRTIISLAKNLNLKTIAEGIETEEQRTLLKNLHCDYGQGYLFCKPVSIKEMIPFIKKHS